MKITLTKTQPLCWRNSLETGSMAGALRLLLPVVLVLFTFGFGMSQQGCACNDVVSLGLNNVPNGTTSITRDMILEDPASCPDDFIRIVYNGQVLQMSSRPSDHPNGLPGAYYYFNLNCNQVTPMGVMLMCGERLTAEILDWDGNVLCWGYVDVEDKRPPTCVINDVTIPCDLDDSPQSINAYFNFFPSAPTAAGIPQSSDNCGLSPDSPEFEDIFDTRNNCGVGYFIRRWTTTDRCGNTATCEQTITTVDQEAPTIEWPEDVTMACDNADTSVDANGEPSVEDNCSNFAIHHTDWEFVECEDMCYKVLREWEILDWCNYNPVTGSGIYSHTQVIKVIDTIAPEVEVEDLTFGTDHTTCLVDVLLPFPEVTNNCEDDSDDAGFGYSVSLHEDANGSCPEVDQADVDALIGFGEPQSNGQLFEGLECGDYLAVWTINDCCGNVTTAVQCITVVDDTPPVAICDQNSQITLTYGPNPATQDGCDQHTGDGWAIIHKDAIDDGSYDNCEVKDIKIGKGEFGPWRDELTFGCDEKGDNKVWLRVRDEKNNESKCWVTVVVEDKAGPDMDCPDDATIYCGDDRSPDALGYPEVRDECCFDLEFDDNDDLYCGGTITRTWTANDWASNPSNCTQTITVLLPPIDIQCPADQTLSCDGFENTNPDVTVTGDITVNVPDTCNIIGVEGPEDWRLDVVDSDDEKIIRKWTVINWCTGEEYVCEQKIVLTECDDASSQPTFMIAGQTKTTEDGKVNGVNMDINNGLVNSVNTMNGSFAFYNMPWNQNYTVTPTKNDDYKNGVSTLDIILMRRHILGIDVLDTPYKLLAADVNNSNSITTFDMIQTRQLVLNQITEFPNNDSWIFIDADYEFANDANPYGEDYPTSIDVMLTEDVTDANFTAVKVGDLNGNAANATGTQVRNDDVLAFQVEDMEVVAGETYTVDFTAQDFTDILGYQFTMEFAGLDFVNVEAGSLPELTEANFGLNKAAEGYFTASWDNLSAVSMEDDAVLFSVTFQATATTQLSEALNITSRVTSAEAYNSNIEVSDVAIEFGTDADVAGESFELFQNRPNPFTGETIISFNLPEAGFATMRVFDVSGKVLRSVEGDYNKGYNEVAINASELNGSGVMYYELTTANHKATKKMILIK